MAYARWEDRRGLGCGSQDRHSHNEGQLFVCVLSHLINKSVMASHMPSQWQTAITNPVPKVSGPSPPADYRPISGVPILSRMVERIIVHKHLYPALHQYPIAENIKDQFAFRPILAPPRQP